MLQAHKHRLLLQWFEPELGTTRRNRVDDAAGGARARVSSELACSSRDAHCHDTHSPADVVANQTEPSDLCVRFHRASKRGLGFRCQRVRFIKNDDLERRAGVSTADSQGTNTSARHGKHQAPPPRTYPELWLLPTAVCAKFFTVVRTTLMPRSSLALSSLTRSRNMETPKSSRQTAVMVEVFPVPGGP